MGGPLVNDGAALRKIRTINPKGAKNSCVLSGAEALS